MPLDAPVMSATLPVRSGPGTAAWRGLAGNRAGRPTGAGPAERSGRSINRRRRRLPGAWRVRPSGGATGEDVLVLAQHGFEGGFAARGSGCTEWYTRRLAMASSSPGRRGRFRTRWPLTLRPLVLPEVADLPVPGVLVGQFAVEARHIRELQADVAGFSAAHGEDTAIRGSGRRRRPGPVHRQYPWSCGALYPRRLEK